MKVVPKTKHPITTFVTAETILSSKNHHTGEKESTNKRKGSKIKTTCFELNILGFALYKTFEWLFEPKDGTTLIY